jgi:ligand-binding sensor domain-containing protein
MPASKDDHRRVISHLRAVTLPDRTIRLWWNPPAKDCRSVVREYRVYVGEGKVNWERPIATLPAGAQTWQSKKIRPWSHAVKYGVELPSPEQWADNRVVKNPYDTHCAVIAVTDEGEVRSEEAVARPFYAFRSMQSVWAIFQDAKGSLWVGTTGGILVRPSDAEQTERLQTAGAVCFLALRGKTGRASVEKWVRIETADGLPDDDIRALCEDRQGRLWVGTAGGLACYDGTSWRTYGTTDGLPDDDIRALCENRQGRLWVGTAGGLACYDGTSWRTYGTTDGLPDDDIQTLCEDRQGRLWAGTYQGGLACYDGTSWRTYRRADGLPDDDIQTLCEDRQGRLWVGTYQGGLACYDGTSWRTYRRADGLPDDRVWALCEDPQGRLWVGTEGSLARYDGTSWRTYGTTDGLPDDRVRALCEDRQGRLWVGTYRGGLACYDGTSWRTYRRADGLPDDAVRALCEDRQGRLWVGTYQGGLACYDGTSWLAYRRADGLPNKVAWALCEDPQGRLWVGTEGSLARYDGTSWRTYGTTDGLPDDRVRALCKDRQGRLWVGTPGGLAAYDGTNWRTYRQTDGLPADNVWAISEDRQGRLWVGTAGGLACYDGTNWRTYRQTDGLPADNVWAISEDRQGRLWVGTAGGLACYDGISWRTYGTRDGLPNDDVRALCEDWQGRLWVGTRGGLACYDGTSWRTYRTAEGLPNEVAWALCVDRQGRLWVGTAGGLVCYDVRYRQIFSRLWWNPVGQTEQSLPASLPSALVQSEEFCREAPDVAEWQGIHGRLTFAATVEELGTLHQELARVFTIIETRQRPRTISLLTLDVLRQLIQLQQVTGILSTKLQRAASLDDQVYLLDGAIGILQANLETVSQSFRDHREREYFSSLNDLWLRLIRERRSALHGRADLACDLTPRRARVDRSGRVQVALSVENRGRGPAEDIVIEPTAGGDTKQVEPARRSLPFLGRGVIEHLEFTVEPARAGDRLRVEFLVTYRDGEGRDKSLRFADAIEIAAAPRGEPFRSIELNPYVIGKPVRTKASKVFVGREDVFEFMVRNLRGAEQDNILVLQGERRIGKSSALYQAQHRLPGLGYFPVIVDVQGFDGRGNDRFFFKVAAEISEQLPTMGMSPPEPDESLSAADASHSFRYRYLPSLFRLLDGKKLILMLDEFEVIERRIKDGKLDPSLLDYIRSLMQHTAVRFIFAGTHELAQLRKDYWGIFFNSVRYKKIGLLERDDAIKLITDPVRDFFEYDELAVQKILDTTAGHPFFTQCVCHAVVEIREKRRLAEDNYVGTQLIEDAIAETLKGAGQNLDYLWDQATPEEQAVLLVVSELLGPVEDPRRPDASTSDIGDHSAVKARAGCNLRKVVNSLVDRDLLEEPRQGHYRLKMGLVRRWILREKRLEDLAPVAEAPRA